MVTLRPYQTELVDNVLAARERGLQRVMAAAPTGTGKTVSFVALHSRFPAKGKTLVLAHREELLSQAAASFQRADPNCWVEVEQASRRAGAMADVIVASVQTLGRPHSKRLEWLRPKLVICDECFPAGTLVDGRPIEGAKAGDLIRCFDHDAGTVVTKAVVRTFKRVPSGMVRVHLADGRQVVCTPEHPIFAWDTRKEAPEYLAAGRLNRYYMVYGTIDACGVTGGCDGDKSKDLRGVRDGLPAEELEQRLDADLLRGVQIKAAAGAREDSSSPLRNLRRSGGMPWSEPVDAGSTRGGLLLGCLQEEEVQRDLVSDGIGDQSAARVRSNEAEEPDARSSEQGEDVNDFASYGVEAHRQGRKRSAYGASNAPGGSTGMGDGSAHQDRGTPRQWLSGRLQSGHRERGPEGSNRGGRGDAQEPDPARGRHQEGCLLGFTWVDGVEVLEQGRDGRFGGLCPDGFVYNLEVEEHHNYFASGVLVHNCHHACAATYLATFKRFGCFEAGGPFLLGVTATPKRLDRLNLHSVFEEQVYTYTIRDAIRDGYLCDIVGYRVATKTDLSKVKTVAGDYNQGQLEKAVDVEERTGEAIRHWQEVAADRPTIVFCAGVDHAEHVAASFREKGIAAEHVSGRMDRDERREVIERFKSGTTQVLANVDILTEGFDHPPTSCILMMRPTQSWGLYVQCIGRGCRLAPGKPDLIVLDVVDVCQQHSLATVPAILDLPAGLDLQGHSLAEAAEKLAELGTRAAALEQYQPTLFSDIETMLQRVDLFAAADPPAEVLDANCRLAWLRLPDASYYVSCGGGTKRREARLTRDLLGAWTLTLAEGGRPVSRGVKPPDTTPKEALWLSDRACRKRWPDAEQVAAVDARWRTDTPSEKQVDLLRKLGYEPGVIAGMTKGQASGLITQAMERRPAARANRN